MEIRNDNGLMSRMQDWQNLSMDELTSHVFYQKSEHTIDEISNYLEKYRSKEVAEPEYHTAFVWSTELRDFSLLLRDSLLGLIKHNQYVNDEKSVDQTFLSNLTSIIKQAATEVVESGQNAKISNIEINQYIHQANPVPHILKQIDEINIQLKKIYRSHDKVNGIRLNLESFKREFHLNFQKQINVVESLTEQISAIGDMMDKIHPKGTKEQITSVIDEINTTYSKLESLQAVESMEVLSYADKVNLNIPVKIYKSRLITKSLDIQSEISKWFSGNVYPHIIELENRRNLSLEASLVALNRARVKLAALILDDHDEYDTSASDVKAGITDLKTQHILPIIKEAEENTKKIESYLDQDFYASSIYDEESLFMPNNGSVQMTNISRDAQKRMITTYRKYKKSIYSWFQKSLATYVELDRIPHNSFISNKLLINKNDERLSLFLKKGYLGKSFTIPRPELINPILRDYELWKDGYAAAILIHGKSGTGKSALIGILSQSSVTDEMINVNAGEPYFTKNKSFDRSFNIKKVIANIANQYIGQKIILTIDDLGKWHNDKHNLYDNINELSRLIQKYKGDIFFIVSVNTYLKARIDIFKDLSLLFSSQIKVGKLANTELKEALMMRFRALPELGLSDTEHENTISPILRNANGNVGHAMLEYSRFYNADYKPDLKSQEFIELVRDYDTILKYILCFQSVNERDLASMLTQLEEVEFRNHIRYLIGLKVLVYTRANIISINPFLIYSIEEALDLKTVV